jgi:PST family polysaccharide transporter
MQQKLSLIKIKFQKLFQNTFIKVSGANGIITILKSVFVIISNKVVATIIGTSGIAMVGQLQSFISIVTLLSNGGFNQGLTKYLAEKNSDKNRLREFIGTAFITVTFLSILFGVLILIFSKSISIRIFTVGSYFSVLIVFAVTLLFYNLNALILSIVNGFQQYKQYFKINITTTLVGFILTVSLVLLFQEYGALLAIVLAQSVVFVLAYFYVRKDDWAVAFSLKYFDKSKLKLLLKYTAITALSAVIWPIVAMIIRTYVINEISAQEAGLWEATRNLNGYIVNIAIGSFSVYLLPKLSSITGNSELKKELVDIYKIIIPVVIVSFLLLYVFKDFVIVLLYTKDFLKVGHYLLLQMVGSFFWLCKVPIMNYILAKGHTTLYLINELIFAAMYIGLAAILIPKFQVQGIQMSFAIYNFVYLLVNIYLIKRMLNK